MNARIVVCGAGPVGAAFGAFLVDRGWSRDAITIVDARTRDAAAADDRMIAIAHGSATLLDRIGAWSPDHDAIATPIHRVHISQRGRFGRTVIDRSDYAVPALGYVVRYGDLAMRLERALDARGIEVVRPARVVGCAADGASARVELDAHDAIDARIVVHAEGGLFAGQADREIRRDYGQTAITSFVTTVSRDDEQANVAFERFTEDGPIALLPARIRHRDRDVRGWSVVWCGRPDDAARRMALDDAAFADALHVAFGDRLGRFDALQMRRLFPLGLNAHRAIGRALSRNAAEFAIGNAAQTLHPVAGQGLNLGLRDAFELSRVLAGSSIALPDAACDMPSLVARYDAARRADRSATIDLTDLMPRVFASRIAPVALGRGIALAALDLASPLRAVFARQMMMGRRSGPTR